MPVELTHTVSFVSLLPTMAVPLYVGTVIKSRNINSAINGRDDTFSKSPQILQLGRGRKEKERAPTEQDLGEYSKC